MTRRVVRYNPAARGPRPRFPRQKAPSMSYAIIHVGGKQYRVREGERLLVDRSPSTTARRSRRRCCLSAVTATPKIAPERCRRDGESRRAGEGAEDPHRQVQEAHGLQATHRLPRLADPDRDRVDRRRQGEAGPVQAGAVQAGSRCQGRRSGRTAGGLRRTHGGRDRGRRDMGRRSALRGARLRAHAREAQGRDRPARAAAGG